MRSYNLLAGNTAADDTCSHRLLNEGPLNGPGAGSVLAEHFEGMKKEYYKSLGWDEETSKPLPETLKKLELDFIIPALWG